jgi:hypothetical protein
MPEKHGDYSDYKERLRREYHAVIVQAKELSKTLGTQGIWQALSNFRIEDQDLRRKLFRFISTELGVSTHTKVSKPIIHSGFEITDEILKDAAKHEALNSSEGDEE